MGTIGGGGLKQELGNLQNDPAREELGRESRKGDDQGFLKM